jgi:hypothetical protein
MQTQPQNVGLLGLPRGPVYTDPQPAAAPSYNCTTTQNGMFTNTQCN